MLDGHAAEADAGAEILGFIGSPSPAHAPATQPGPAWRHNEMPPNHGPDASAHMFDSDRASGAAPDAPIDVQSEVPVPERVSALLMAHRHDDPIHVWAERARRLALDLSGTTPTLLPDLLRAVSRQAGHLAGDPFNALDNNPFIVREWLIVSQVLHAAATSLEKRFDALFQGI